MRTKININGAEVFILVKFDHITNDKPIQREGKRPFIGRTQCIIHIEGGSDDVRGYAHCAVGDQFNKAKGRKLALKRAIKHLGDVLGSVGMSLKKQDRAKIWECYFKNVKK
jgi:hypothetical protein